VVLTDQLEPSLAITGRLLYGQVSDAASDGFESVAQQQLFSLEEIVGMVSALVGPPIEEQGSRVLYMGQELELLQPVSIGDHLDAVLEIVERRPGTRGGERVTASFSVNRHGEPDRMVAWGNAVFLVMEVQGER
jgi:acyl dehydratase